jgi:hypothetical protein
MLRNALIAIAAGSAIAAAVPLAAQSTGQPAAGAGAAAQTNTQMQATTQTKAATPTADVATTADAKAQPADPKAKANTAATCQNVVAAGPNRGQVIGKCKSKPKTDATADDKADPKN